MSRKVGVMLCKICFTSEKYQGCDGGIEISGDETFFNSFFFYAILPYSYFSLIIYLDFFGGTKNIFNTKQKHIVVLQVVAGGKPSRGDTLPYYSRPYKSKMAPSSIEDGQ